VDDIESDHAAKASALIKAFHERGREILVTAGKAFDDAMEALRTAHAEFSTDLGTLGANTEAQIHNRLETTRQKHEELLCHFMGKIPVKEPVIRTKAPTALPNVTDAPEGFAERFTGGAGSGGDAAGTAEGEAT
jgi:hypothetical protein